ncbi:hypothetical protein AB6A40_002423 [Gnathostoma spinigerum]|uniref:Ketoreductase domain-containing protein n=1 Tax=Gnathostoma spinigerum TaxID=75299 RepID=A0ABD6EC41_9BILA
MATVSEGNSQLLGSVSAALTVLGKLVLACFIGFVKAVLPRGVLPRKNVQGETVLITGSGSGLGRLMAIEFAKLGANLVLWDINEPANEETKKMVEKHGAKATSYTVDLSKREQIYATAERVKGEAGNVSILINNAGVVTGKSLMDSSDEKILLTMAINANAVVFTTKAFLPHMLEVNSGHIVTISSIAGKVGIAGLVDYCMSKHASVGFTSALTEELIHLKKSGIRTTTVCPYVINTGMFDGFKNSCPWLIPILSPSYVVENIMEAVLTEMEIIYIPKLCYFLIFLLNFLPTSCTHIICEYLQANDAMDTFVGRSIALSS